MTNSRPSLANGVDHEARLRRLEEMLGRGEQAEPPPPTPLRPRGRPQKTRQAADVGNPSPDEKPPKRFNRPSPPAEGDEG